VTEGRPELPPTVEALMTRLKNNTSPHRGLGNMVYATVSLNGLVGFPFFFPASNGRPRVYIGQNACVITYDEVTP
jgi:hypothetical protein